MTPQETALVTTLLERLKTTGGQPKDPEAELLIRPITTEQADAAYYLVQTVLIQDFSLHNAQHRITELERNLAQAKTALARSGLLAMARGDRDPLLFAAGKLRREVVETMPEPNQPQGVLGFIGCSAISVTSITFSRAVRLGIRL